jgi:hypothetical protein
MNLRKKVLPGLTLGLLLAGAALMATPRGVDAHPGEGVPGTVALDFLTGGGFIIRDSGAKGNFGIQGGVKNEDWWGGVNYIDHGTGLHVQGRDVTGYLFIDERTRDICGRGTSNLFGDIVWHVRATDNGEPGVDDVFIIRVGKAGAIVYTTEHDSNRTLGGSGPGGGNIQLHKGNNSHTPPAEDAVCEI